MMKPHYIIKEGKELRCGYTTGSCAAGAAKAATCGLILGEIPSEIEIETPAGINLTLPVTDRVIQKDFASCSIVKDAGDDPDVTHGIKIFAIVRLNKTSSTQITGGEGIGIITEKGFWGEIGDAAINKVPRQMIKKEINKITQQGISVEIYAPRGKEIAEKTFNKHIGIKGGISIIGTSGIVEPMSDEALKKSIYLEIDHNISKGAKQFVLFPGNYGEKIVKEMFKEKDVSKIGMIKVSNFLGDALLYCENKGIKSIAVIGHIGKLCKVSIGIFNTHSRVADGRLEAFVYYLALNKAPFHLLEEVSSVLTTENIYEILLKYQYEHIIEQMAKGAETRIKKYLKDESYDITVLMYSMTHGILGKGEIRW